nr:cardiolipin synthase [uncultured Ruminococcus sp.]
MKNKEQDKKRIAFKKGIISMVFSRFGIVLVLLALQILVLLGLFLKFSQLAPHYYIISAVFYIFMITVIVNSDHDASSKITWLTIMAFLPIFGALLYIYTTVDIGHRVLKKKVTHILKNTKDKITQDKSVIDKAEEICPDVADLNYYLNKSGRFPLYENTDVTYYPIGEKMFQSMLVELDKAKDFIFMEYFIVDDGYMWDNILEVLIKKANEGVDVRVMYDGTCEFALLPRTYPSSLEKLGIHCKVFSPVSPFISTHYNYRDHRKIMVIDGKTAYNGGINMADEYINYTHKYGHFKDVGVMLKGDAVDSFTLMFLQMWSVNERHCDFSKYLNVGYSLSAGGYFSNGFVMPFGDCPLDEYDVGKSVYMDILNRAKDYVYIMTPYMIMDGELENSLTFSAERGVDVRIILPHISDSFVAQALAKTHYKNLLDAGVKVYEYTPGFVHAKVFVSDDVKSVVGSINMDYRSLYHHFECATYMYGTRCIDDIKSDYKDTLAKCQQVTYESIKNDKWYIKLIGKVIKFVAPLI